MKIAYWVCTLWVAVTALLAGVADVSHAPALVRQLVQLGYPVYFGTMLGVWKIAGALVLLAPRHPLIKEWAYAGMFIDYSSAVVSYSAVGGRPADFAGPLVSIAALFASWYLRSQSRALPQATSAANCR